MSFLPHSGDGIGSSSRPGAVSLDVPIVDVEAPTARAPLGQVKDDNPFNVWNYGFNIGQGFKYGFCGKSKRSGGATRLTMHLAGFQLMLLLVEV